MVRRMAPCNIISCLKGHVFQTTEICCRTEYSSLMSKAQGADVIDSEKTQGVAIINGNEVIIGKAMVGL